MSWLVGWSYRKVVPINASVDGVLTNHPMPIKIYRSDGADGTESIGCRTAGKVYISTKCEADYDDIRVTKADGVTLLDYWIEHTAADANSALIWVEVDTIPDTGSVNICIYYGNASVSADSDGEATFPFFDDFPGVSLDGSKWSGSGTTVASSICTISNGGIGGLVYYAKPKAIRAYFKTTHFNSNSYVEYLQFTNSDGKKQHIICPCTTASGLQGKHLNYNSPNASSSAIAGMAANTYCVGDILFRAADATFFIDNANQVTPATTYWTSDNKKIGLNGSGASAGSACDWCLVRNITTNEPTWGSWGSEEGVASGAPSNISKIVELLVN